MVTVARAVACPARLEILRRVGAEGCTLTEVARQANLAVSTAAFHLTQLLDAGLVTKVVKGRRTIYRWSRSRWALVRLAAPARVMPPDDLA